MPSIALPQFFSAPADIIPRPGDAVFVSRKGLRRYVNAREIVTAFTASDVPSALDRVERAVDNGLHAAGYLAYECAPAFESALVTHAPESRPILWFGIYDKCERSPVMPDADGPMPVRVWAPRIARADYDRAVARIHEWIAAGDTYQVNFTFPIETAFDGDPWQWFLALCNAQRADYCAYIDTGEQHILSVSPELFFRLDGSRIETRPMKGTCARGLTFEDDLERARRLRESAKERAENVMIVDMIRNDLGRIARPGTVDVASLFDVERYDTVWQMTSTVAAETRATVPEILRALFPSASVTGAPKVRTMQIIRELERQPRGVYCGAIGWWGPHRQAEFNVAIRTLTHDRETGHVRYHVGGGITWDSVVDREYDECLLKAKVLETDPTPFQILESLRWDGGFFLLDRHLERMRRSASYFGFPFDETAVRRTLARLATTLPSTPQKVRLLLARSGDIDTTAEPIGETRILRVAFAAEPIQRDNLFLYHKTTRRDVYTRARAARPDCDDVILYNEAGEITESTVANIVAELNGRRYTPPVACGLLPGVLREELLATGEIQERVLTRNDLEMAEKVFLINSVRKWMPAILV